MTLAEFARKRGFYKPVVAKKKSGKKHYLMWWESSDDYYLNVMFTRSTVPDPKKSPWICRCDVEHYVDVLKRQGYEIVDVLETVEV